MFVVNDDLSIYATRGDIVFFTVTAEDAGKNYKFQVGDVVRIKVYGKKDAENVVLQKDFPVTEITESVDIYLTEQDTKIGEVISKPKDYWYEIELNPYDNPQTIIGYDEDGAKVFKLFPEGDDVPEYVPPVEEIPVVDEELDMASTRPVQNQAIARAVANIEDLCERTHAAVAEVHVTPEMFGAIGDGVADDTESLQSALDTRRKLYIPTGVYKVTSPLTACNSIVFEKDAYIEFYPANDGDTCIKFSGSLTTLGENLPCTCDGACMTVSGVDVQAGDYLYISNDELAAPTAREYDTKRDILQVLSVADGTITFATVPEYSYTTVNIAKMNTIDNIVIDGVKIRCMELVGNSCGIALEYAKNATIKNCHVSNFDYSQISLNNCVFCDAHSNLCEVDYADALQYGIVVHSSANITVYGNKANSRRTAIDVTRLSNKVTVTANTVFGSINTHSCTNTTITNNAINDGTILIRGKNVLVSGNSVQSHDIQCIDIEEMGIEGGHVISNNIFKGYCSMKCYFSNISITNNHFIVEKVMSYGDGAFESVIRLMTAGTPNKTDGATIAGNTFEAVGITPIYCIESYCNTSIINNLVVQDNVIRGFATGLYFPQRSSTSGNNLIIKNNMMLVSHAGIAYRCVNNTQIVGNTIIGSGSATGNYGIYRLDISSGETVGLIIRDNFIKGFSVGVKVGGSANMWKAVYMDNAFDDCTTNSTGISGNAFRVGNEVFAVSPNGTVYYLKVGDDGVLSPTAMDYTN